MAKKKPLTAAAPESPDYMEQWQRAQADLENLQKRSQKERVEAADWAQKQIILDLLPVVDNFDRALAHVPADQQESGWLTGITYIHKQLLDFLSTYDVVKVDIAPNTMFDPNQHHAVQTVSSELPKDQIVSVIAAPYLMKGELLRPGSVTVSSGEDNKETNEQ
jgi:molecular chaperone GrpE